MNILDCSTGTEEQRNNGTEEQLAASWRRLANVFCKERLPTVSRTLCHFVTFPHTVGNHPASTVTKQMQERILSALFVITHRNKRTLCKRNIHQFTIMLLLFVINIISLLWFLLYHRRLFRLMMYFLYGYINIHNLNPIYSPILKKLR